MPALSERHFIGWLVLLVFLLLALPAEAATAKHPVQQKTGVFGYWRTYTIKDHGQKVCYMTLVAHFPKMKNFQRSDALLTVTHRPEESSKDVISYTAGYNYKPMSSAELHVGKMSYNLFTAQDTAWSRDAVTDHIIAKALRFAPGASITGTPAKKGTRPVTDRFSLKGADEAYHAISKSCGVEVLEKPASKAKTAVKPAKRKL